MAQGQDDNEKKQSLDPDKKRDKDHPPSKVVIRRLPPTLTPEDFLEQVSPLPDYDFFYFVRADLSLGPNAFTRAYINFIVPEDVFLFRDKFDGYVFLDAKGGEFPAVVEFAPFQKVPKKKAKKVDAKNGIIEQDSDFKKFLELLANPPEAPAVSLDAIVEEVEAREIRLAKMGMTKTNTPLLEFLKKRKEERRYNIAKLKEERRRGSGRGRNRDNEVDLKRSVKDNGIDKRRPGSEKERIRDRDRRREKVKDRPRDRDKDRKRERDLRRSERYKEGKDGDRMKTREGESSAPRQTVMLLKNVDRENQMKEKGAESGIRSEMRDRERSDHDQGQERLSGKGGRDGRMDEMRQGGGKWRGGGRDDRRYEEDGREGDRPRSGKDRGGEEGRDRGKGFQEDYNRRKQERERNEDRGGRDKFGERDRGGGGRGMDRDRGGGGRAMDRERGGGAKYYEKEKMGRGGSAREKHRDERGGGGRYRDDRRGGRGDGGGMGGSGRNRDADFEKGKPEKERRQDPERNKGQEDGVKKKIESGSQRESRGHDPAREDRNKEKQKEEDRAVRNRAGSDPKLSKVRGEDESQSESSTQQPRPSRGEDESKGDNGVDVEERRRKRKERPERQIYIPRRALERQKQESAQSQQGADEEGSKSKTT